jgi:hypothetical protein
MWFCVTVTEFVFGVLERRVTESEHTLGGMCYNNGVMWRFVSVNRCKEALQKRPNNGCGTAGQWKQHVKYARSSPSSEGPFV